MGVTAVNVPDFVGPGFLFTFLVKTCLLCSEMENNLTADTVLEMNFWVFETSFGNNPFFLSPF